MAMSREEFEYLQDVIAHFEDAPGMVSGWEQGFMEDQSARVKKYGADTLISVKQWNIINKVADKYEIKRGLSFDSE